MKEVLHVASNPTTPYITDILVINNLHLPKTVSILYDYIDRLPNHFFLTMINLTIIVLVRVLHLYV